MKRRTSLKIAGISGFSIAADCDSRPDKTLFSQVRAPEDQVTGMAKNMGGRIIKTPDPRRGNRR